MPPGPFPRNTSRRTFDTAAELTSKAMSLAPTAELREAIRAKFGALWGRWKTEVLHEAGTLRRGLQANAQAFAQELAHEPFPADALERLDFIGGTIRQQVALLMELEGVAPDPEQALIKRLTAAHEAAQQARAQAQDPSPQSTNPQQGAEAQT
jgi:hypothetical protein